MGSPNANKKPKQYPDGTNFENWIVVQEPGIGPRIKRQYTPPGEKKRVERYPLDKFRHLLDDRIELDAFVIRLNGDDPLKRRAREVAEIKHAYISEEFLQTYYDTVLSVKVESDTNARTSYKYLLEYGLHYFMVKLKSHSPKDWKKQESLWGKALLNREDSNLSPEHRLFKEGERKASRTLGYIVFEMNRFLKYLHKMRPEEMPLVKLEPLDKQTKKTHDAYRELAGEIDKSKYVTDEHWALIREVLVDRNIPYAPLIYLCRAYGLRRNEGLGVTVDCIKNEHLDITKQLKTYKRAVVPKVVRRKGEKKEPRSSAADTVEYKPLKGRTVRKVPHWYSDPDDTYEWVEAITLLRKHPDTITVEFGDLTTEICGERYNIDDLRPTFLTDAMGDAVAKDPKAGPETVRLAAGHAKLETTYNHYIKDTRKLSEQVYVPKKKRAS